jgi:hypothetical protein
VSVFPSPYLASLPDTERRHVLELARAAETACEDWLVTYPIVLRPSVTAACSLVSAVALPTAGPSGVGLLTRWWLWVFGVDDVFDDPDVDDSTVERWASRFLDDPPTDAADIDRLRAALGSIRRDLSAYPLFARYADRWRTEMTDIVRAMALERRWAVRPPSTLQAYLDTATTTISVRPYALTACVITGEPAAPASFDTLGPPIRAAARCFRLANDMRSEARERHEGKINALWVLQRQYASQGLDRHAAGDAARRQLTATCRADLAYLDTTRRTAPRDLATLAQFLWAHTAFVWEMYQIGDYDTISTLLRERTHP